MPESIEAPSINFFSEEIEFSLSYSDSISKWLIQSAIAEGKQIDYLNIVFCSDEYLLGINQQYLEHDYYTDIITFDYGDDAIQGELYISIDRVKENAEDLKIKFERELQRVMIHGLLHICGYGDKTEEEVEKIRKQEDYYIQKCQEYVIR